jgi:hypothetical protein
MPFHRRDTHLEQFQDGKHNVVTVAEAGRLSLLCMVHAACVLEQSYHQFIIH